MNDNSLSNIANSNDSVSHHQTIIFNLVNDRVAKLAGASAVKFRSVNMND